MSNGIGPCPCSTGTKQRAGLGGAEDQGILGDHIVSLWMVM